MPATERKYSLSANTEGHKSDVPLRHSEVVGKVQIFEFDTEGTETLSPNAAVDRIIFIARGVIEVTIQPSSNRSNDEILEVGMLRVSGRETLSITTSGATFTVLEVVA